MRSTNDGNRRMKTTPIPVNRTGRKQVHRILTSMPAGKFTPLAAIPLLREDSLAGAQFSIGVEMGETVEILMNSVQVRVRAYLVPRLASSRFDGMDSLNRSYEGKPPIDTDPPTPVVPWFETAAAPAHGVNEVFTYMGKHFKPGTTINLEYVEAYNTLWNFLATNRSPDISLRGRLDTDLAPAFWAHQTFAHVVPDFDQAIIDGQVALNIVSSTMPLSASAVPVVRAGDGVPLFKGPFTGGGHIQSALRGGGSGSAVNSTVGQVSSANLEWATTNLQASLAGVVAEMQEGGITVSLSNIDMARRTQAFANLRRQYNGHSDDYIIDLLMDGISIPEQAWRQPIMLFDDLTTVGMSKRYASDSGNLTESVVNGMTGMQMRFSCPRVPCGGVILIVAEAVPEQLFERQRDPYLHASSVDDLPQFLRDELDPEKVQIVRNDEVDTDHDTPANTFGYAPLNHQWMRSIPQIGGKFYRPEVDAGFDEDRQRIWAVETQNPVLSEDFYLCTTMHLKPFVDQVSDPFEVLMRGETAIQGNTVFGGMLIEATDDYDKVAAEAPMDRIEKP